MISFEKVSDNHYKVKRYEQTISYFKFNTAIKKWYVGTIRMTLGASELRAIADQLDKLDKEDS